MDDTEEMNFLELERQILRLEELLASCREVSAQRAEEIERLKAQAVVDGHALLARCREVLISERANNIRLQIRAEDYGRPAHNYPDGQPRVDRSVNEEVLARRQIEQALKESE